MTRASSRSELARTSRGDRFRSVSVTVLGFRCTCQNARRPTSFAVPHGRRDVACGYHEPGRDLWRPLEEVHVFVLRTLGLFVATAVAEILGCYLPYLWLRRGQSAWVLGPSAAC